MEKRRVKMKLKEWDEKSMEKHYTIKQKGDFAGDISSKEIVRLSQKYIGKKVLDVGAGSGALIDLIPNSIGLDLSPKNKKIIKGSVTKIPFSDNLFNTLFVTEVLEHLDEGILKKGLKEIKRVLKKNGFFIITTPYNEQLSNNTVACLECGAVFHQHGHMRSFNVQQMKSLLEGFGFKIIKIKLTPLGFDAKHKILKHFLPILNLFGFKRAKNIFVVAQKI